MQRQHIIKRLRSLRNWEFANVFLLPFFLWFMMEVQQVSTRLLYIYGMAVASFILLQGSYYWHLKLKSVQKGARQLPDHFYRTFSIFKVCNYLLLGLYPLLLIFALLTSATQPNEPFWATMLFIFAFFEQINYYHYQLMHDNRNDINYLKEHKRLRRAPLAVDLTAARER